MPLPVDLNTITVTAAYPNIAGQPQSGYVTFDPGAVVTDSTGHVILTGAVRCNVVNGVLQPPTLPCTDNGGLNPTGFAYTVTEVIGLSKRSYQVELPHTIGATVDLSSLSPVTQPPNINTFSGDNTWTGGNTFGGEVAFTEGAVAGDVWTCVDDTGLGEWASPGATSGVLLAVNNLSDVQSVTSARTNLGLGSAATHAATDFDAAGAATAAAAASLPLAGGTLTGRLAPAVVALTFASTIAVNSALGNDFRLTLTASTGTIGTPANPVDGTVIEFQVTQDSTGSRTVAWSAAYNFGAASAPTLSTAASKTDIIGFKYNAAKTQWLYLGSTLGY